MSDSRIDSCDQSINRSTRKEACSQIEFNPPPRTVLPPGEYRKNVIQQFFWYSAAGSTVCPAWHW